MLRSTLLRTLAAAALGATLSTTALAPSALAGRLEPFALVQEPGLALTLSQADVGAKAAAPAQFDLARWLELAVRIDAPFALLDGAGDSTFEFDGRVRLLFGERLTSTGDGHLGIDPLALDPATAATLFDGRLNALDRSLEFNVPVPAGLPLGAEFVTQALAIPDDGGPWLVSAPIDLRVVDAFAFDLRPGVEGWSLEPTLEQLIRTRSGAHLPGYGLLLAPSMEVGLARQLNGLEPGREVELRIALAARELDTRLTTSEPPALPTLVLETETHVGTRATVLDVRRSILPTLDLVASGRLQASVDASGRVRCVLRLTSGDAMLELSRIAITVGR